MPKEAELQEFENMNLRDLVITMVSDFRNFKKYPWNSVSKKVDEITIVLAEKADKSDIAALSHKQTKMSDELISIASMAKENADKIRKLEIETEKVKKRVSSLEVTHTVKDAKVEGVRDVGRFTWGFITKAMAIISFLTMLFSGTVVSIVKALRAAPEVAETQANAFVEHVHSIIDKIS